MLVFYIPLDNTVEKLVYYLFVNIHMNEKYNVYLVSDSTGETLDRIFLSLKSQFANFSMKKRLSLLELSNKLIKLLKNA